MFLIEVLTQGRKDVVGIRSPLVVLRLVHPQHPPIRIDEQGSGDRKGFGADRRRRARVEALVAQAEAVAHLKLSIRKHRRAKLMPAVSLDEFARGVRADCQDPHATFVKFGPEFFPSPQLGDTIGSPVCAKKLDEHRMPRKALRVERFSEFICRRERGDRGSHLNGIARDLLAADRESQ